MMKVTNKVVHHEQLLPERITSASATMKNGSFQIVLLRLPVFVSSPVAVTITRKSHQRHHTAEFSSKHTIYNEAAVGTKVF
jgi:hypothetical protein